jgi:hypothetical protein
MLELQRIFLPTLAKLFRSGATCWSRTYTCGTNSRSSSRDRFFWLLVRRL